MQLVTTRIFRCSSCEREPFKVSKQVWANYLAGKQILLFCSFCRATEYVTNVAGAHVATPVCVAEVCAAHHPHKSFAYYNRRGRQFDTVAYASLDLTIRFDDGTTETHKVSGLDNSQIKRKLEFGSLFTKLLAGKRKDEARAMFANISTFADIKKLQIGGSS